MTSPSTDDNAVKTPVVAGIMALLWLLHWLPFVFPQSRFWGFNHLLFLPTWTRVIYGFGGTLIFAFFVPFLREHIVGLYDKTAEILFSEPVPVRWAIISLFSIAVFWIAKPSLFFLGDSFSVTANIGNDLPVIYKWTEIGAIFLANALVHVFPQQTLESGRLAYAIISVISGGLTLFLFFKLAFELGDSQWQRLFLWSVFTFGGGILLFFGYTENYAVLWPFFVGYLYFGIIYLKGKGKLVFPTLFLFISFILHVQIFFFAISYLVLLFSRGKMAWFYHANRSIIWAGLVVIGAVGVFSVIRLYSNSLEFELSLIPLLHARPPVFNYWLLSPTHIIDCLNQLLLVAPLLPFLVYVGWREWIGGPKSKQDIFFGIVATGSLLFLLFVDPKLGMGRDWDLFALTGFIPMLWLSVKAIKRMARKQFPLVALMGIILVFPFITANIVAQPALDNFTYLLRLDIPRARTGITLLKNYYADSGRARLADSLQQVLEKSYPEFTLVPQAYKQLDAGRVAEAQRLADSVFKINPYSTEVLNLCGNILMATRQYDKAIEDFRAAANLGGYDSRMLVALASAYQFTNRYPEAMRILRKAQKRNPQSFNVNEGLATCFYGEKQYDSSYAYATYCITLDSNKANIYMLAGFSAYQMRRYPEAKRYLSTFLQMDSTSSYSDYARKTIVTIR